MDALIFFKVHLILHFWSDYFHIYTNIIPEGFHDEHLHMRILFDSVFQTHMHTVFCELFGLCKGSLLP